ncbi:hypothetical protein JP75_20850 [Devosia riboflavina]|uniref:Gfo/Idh/MocA-like oxidoreductase N-terminal domain-containing protein n=1 Tax=Devosia riboflavina TaxID=46914 RepID=A0A087LY16_9HYPH|nr:Gfo/Idh/MocA family oxidoreductase [Devosia riboflavina]KFL29519.1 hypothetical protein JP75_20850 [Devosia riboflavina]
MPRVAVIGVTGFGSVHIADLLRQVERGRLSLGAAVMRHPEKDEAAAARLTAAGAKLYRSAEALFEAEAGGLDLCTVPTSIQSHADLSVAALEAGANVLVEKPIAATLSEVDAIEAAAKTAGRFVAVGYQTMYAPETMVMKRAILDGDIGAVQAIKCRGMWPRLDRYYDNSNWIGRIKADGRWVLDSPFNNAMAHQLNMLCFLAGPSLMQSAALRSVTAELYRAHAIETADTTALRIDTEAGIPLYFFATHSSETSLDPEIVVRGDKGEIHWTFTNLEIRRHTGTEKLDCLSGPALRDAMMDNIVDRLSGADRFICGPDIGRVHTLVVNGAHIGATIQDLPADRITRSTVDDSIKTVFAGIDDAIAKAFAEEHLFSELGLDWARPARQVDLHDPAAIAAHYR